MRVGMVIFCLGFILFSQINSLAMFYVAFLMLSLGAGLAGFFPLSVSMVNWFERYRARALSTMSLGLAVGGMIVPLVAFCLDTFGWRTTAFASGVIGLIVGLPLVQVMRKRPEDYGEYVDGIVPGSAADADDPEKPSSSLGPPVDFTAKEAMRTSSFWLISLGHTSALLIVSAVTVHAVPHLTENLGYSLAAASLVVTLLTVAQVAGMIAGGYLGDRMDKRKIAIACMAMHSVALLLLAYAANLPMVIAFAILHGFAWGARGPLMQAIRADYFGRTYFGAIMGWSSLIVMLGLIAGPLVAGGLADATGSYEAGFTILAIGAAAGSIFFMLTRRPADLAPREAPAIVTAEAGRHLAVEG
jgi:sugar phosphate permease